MKTPLRTPHSEVLILTDELRRYADGWLLDCKYRQLSPQTIATRQLTTDKFLWFLGAKGHKVVDSLAIRAFIGYVGSGHTEDGGRWGNAQLTKPVRPRVVRDYFMNIRTMFRWMVEEGYIESNPMDGLKPPISRPDQVQPLTTEQVEALMSAARKSKYAKRDEAMLLFMLDTGVRASEICNLHMEDVDVVNKKAIVLGKGNKHRAVFFGRTTSKALMTYLRAQKREDSDRVFITEKSRAFTPNSLRQMVERLGGAARVAGVRCSPHTLRHTCAIQFLRNGGNVFSLQQMLGHTDLAMTRKYLALAQADIQAQHQAFSPVDRIRGGGRK